MSLLVTKCFFYPWSAPVGCYLDVQGHLDIEQVLVLSQVLGHLALQVPQLGVQMAYGVLLHWKIRPVLDESATHRLSVIWTRF